MDTKFLTEVENHFPYPIASDVRLLRTAEFINQTPDRLKKLLSVSENIIHFLSLIALVDLCDNCSKTKIEIPEWYSKEFPKRFVHTSFGTWVALFRDTARLFQNLSIPMFVEKLPEFFVKGKKESDAQKAFNDLTTIRNALAHPTQPITMAIVKQYITETEEKLDLILHELSFLQDYTFDYVEDIRVKNYKYHSLQFNHMFSSINGSDSIFAARHEDKSQPVFTEAVMMTNTKTALSLNLDPLVICSPHGSEKIKDVFLYIDWEPNKYIRYRPVLNGGEYNLVTNAEYAIRLPMLTKFWEYFGDETSKAKYMPKNLQEVNNDDNVVVDFKF